MVTDQHQNSLSLDYKSDFFLHLVDVEVAQKPVIPSPLLHYGISLPLI